MKKWVVAQVIHQAKRSQGSERDLVSATRPHIGSVHLPSRSTGRVSDWLKRHENRRIPRNYDALAQAIGCTKDALKCYLYRRRKAVRERLASLPDLRNSRIELMTESGEIIPGWDLLSYEYHVDLYSLEVTILAKHRERGPLMFTVPDLKVFANRVRSCATAP